MFKFLKILIAGNDWRPVWHETATWQIIDSNGKCRYEERASYTIFFSGIRNKYKLKSEGYKATQHFYYGQAVKVLNGLISKTMQIEANIKIADEILSRIK